MVLTIVEDPLTNSSTQLLVVNQESSAFSTFPDISPARSSHNLPTISKGDFTVISQSSSPLMKALQLSEGGKIFFLEFGSLQEVGEVFFGPPKVMLDFSNWGGSNFSGEEMRRLMEGDLIPQFPVTWTVLSFGLGLE